jgi:hypothetical protein
VSDFSNSSLALVRVLRTASGSSRCACYLGKSDTISGPTPLNSLRSAAMASCSIWQRRGQKRNRRQRQRCKQRNLQIRCKNLNLTYRTCQRKCLSATTLHSCHSEAGGRRILYCVEILRSAQDDILWEVPPENTPIWSITVSHIESRFLQIRALLPLHS